MAPAYPPALGLRVACSGIHIPLKWPPLISVSRFQTKNQKALHFRMEARGSSQVRQRMYEPVTRLFRWRVYHVLEGWNYACVVGSAWARMCALLGRSVWSLLLCHTSESALWAILTPHSTWTPVPAGVGTSCIQPSERSPAVQILVSCMHRQPLIPLNEKKKYSAKVKAYQTKKNFFKRELSSSCSA